MGNKVIRISLSFDNINTYFESEFMRFDDDFAGLINDIAFCRLGTMI